MRLSWRVSPRWMPGRRAIVWRRSISRHTQLDPFFNANTQEDLTEAEQLARDAACRQI